jgi:hypothetical protein
MSPMNGGAGYSDVTHGSTMNIHPQSDLRDIIKIHSYSIKIENYIFQYYKMKHPKAKILSF